MKLIPLFSIGFLTFFGSCTAVEPGSYNTFTDLTYSMSSETLFFPGQKEFTLTKDYEDWSPDAGYAAYSFCMAEHGGTHLDAPYHFYKPGWTVEQIPQENLINVPGFIIDVRTEVEKMKEPGEYELRVEDIIAYESIYGRISTRSVVFVYTGWSKYWPNREKYFGFKEDNSTSYPGISVDAGKWLYNERGIIGLGLDTPSIDLGSKGTSAPLHRWLAAKNVYNLENVANLHLLLLVRNEAKAKETPHPGVIPRSQICKSFGFHIMPMKIVGGTGAPVQILGFCINQGLWG